METLITLASTDEENRILFLKLSVVSLVTKFPLGKTGKKELLDLLIQIDGDADPFAAFGNDKFNKLDSVLQTRHSIIHQDRFSGTETTVQNDLDFLKELVHYIDQYLYTKMQTIRPSLPE